jgi:16S rRNA (cytidine1402-2'-O)-methyltransferase
MNETGKLYVVATPIGNLADITFRAIDTLKAVDLVACEDSRVTLRLLNHYSISKKAVSYHQHSRLSKIDYLIEELKKGKNIALTTDAGTPGISDPGNFLIEKVLAEKIEVIPIPGPSAVGTIVSVAGINMQRFSFFGFPPHKKGRESFFREVATSKIPVIYYESPHRLAKNLETLSAIAPEKGIIIGRELTKVFEQILRGSVEEGRSYFVDHPEKVKGELVIMVY